MYTFAFKKNAQKMANFQEYKNQEKKGYLTNNL